MQINEIKEFSKYKNKVKLQIQAEGYNLIMHSKLKLLNNNNVVIKTNKNTNHNICYLNVLNVEGRDVSNIIVENKTGSYIFISYIFQFCNILRYWINV